MPRWEGGAFSYYNVNFFLDLQKIIFYIYALMVGIAQLVRAPGCGPGGHGFKSRYSPLKIVN